MQQVRYRPPNGLVGDHEQDIEWRIAAFEIDLMEWVKMAEIVAYQHAERVPIRIYEAV